MKQELKPCSHCGKTGALEVNSTTGSIMDYQVICSATMGGCGSSSGFRHSVEEAIKLWNTRAIESAYFLHTEDSFPLSTSASITMPSIVEHKQISETELIWEERKWDLLQTVLKEHIKRNNGFREDYLKENITTWHSRISAVVEAWKELEK